MQVQLNTMLAGAMQVLFSIIMFIIVVTSIAGITNSKDYGLFNEIQCMNNNAMLFHFYIECMEVKQISTIFQGTGMLFYI